MRNKNIAIILAAGEGLRLLSGDLPKQFTKIAGRTILEYTIEAFERNVNIHEIVIVSHPKFLSLCREIADKNGYKKVGKILPGGKTRQESSRIGIFSCDKDTAKILTHDAVRPFVDDEIINAILLSLDKFVAVDVAIPLADTIIRVNDKNIITKMPNRAAFRRGQTPQGFQYKAIKEAYERFMEDKKKEFTDDCGLILKYRLGDVFVVEGKEENIKITYPIDLHIADKLIQLKTSQFSGPYSFEKLRGKNVIILGHTGGIGKEIYTACRSTGANVKGYSRSNGYDICNYGKIKIIFRDYEKEYGKIDILISTVGLLQKKELGKLSVKEAWDQMLVNYVSQVFLVKEAITVMAKRGSIALFTSSSYTRGRAGYAIYSSAKAAIVNLIQALAEELKKKNIYINAICPSRTNTLMRRKNFGKEAVITLIDPKKVARITLAVCLTAMTGQIIDIRADAL